MCMRDMWVVQWYCIFEGLVETREVVGVELYSKLLGKIMGVVCEVVAGFLHGVIVIACWLVDCEESLFFFRFSKKQRK